MLLYDFNSYGNRNKAGILSMISHFNVSVRFDVCPMREQWFSL